MVRVPIVLCQIIQNYYINKAFGTRIRVYLREYGGKTMKKNKKGFTLVELVIVIAVLAILAAIAVPAIGGAITKANAARDESQAQSIETAIKYYISLKETDSTITGNTVADALTKSGMNAADGTTLVCKQKGYVFVYDAAKKTVTAKASADGITAMTSETAIQ